MKLLVTGAFRASQEQLNMLASLGFELFFQKDEMGKPECDFSEIDAVICNGLFLYHDLDKFNNLKFIQLTSAGLDRVPLERINERGIALFNARGVYSIPMAEFAVAGVLSIYKHLKDFYESQKKHTWNKDRTIGELSGATVSIVGCGSVGTECAKRFGAFCEKVNGVDVVNPQNGVYDEFFDIKDIEKTLSVSDIIVLTLPLTNETSGMFNKALFDKVKDGAVLVNIARGAVVNENDLIKALKSGKLGGAVLDVFENEPLSAESPLWDMQNVIVTPHNSFVSDKNNARIFSLAYDNLKKFAKGEV